MTASLTDFALYALALAALFLTPGPVWVALIARAVSGGFHAAWPLAAGVVVGDVLWPLLAILGLAWVAESVDGFMVALKWVAAVIFWIMGIQLIRHAEQKISSDTRLTAPGMWAGFTAGLAVILGNPKAILFYMGVLPGFFDLTSLTPADIGIVVFLSFLIPLLGNLILALLIDRVRSAISSPKALKRLNLTSGGTLILVGCVIPFT
ncbi:MAG: LysE family translocator [Pseudomonadota bacterium]